VKKNFLPGGLNNNFHLKNNIKLVLSNEQSAYQSDNNTAVVVVPAQQNLHFLLLK
jgi:hypothetical protein